MMGICGCFFDSPSHNVVFFSPRKITFAGTLVGAQGLAQDLQLVNLGRGPLAVGQLSLSGADAGVFQVLNHCGETLPGRSTCTVRIVFTPTRVGEATASLALEGKAGSIPQSVALSGTGSTSATADVVVYGATPAGLMAAIEACRQGRSVLLLDPKKRVGGMMTNGLSFTDLSSDTKLGGLGKEFFDRVYARYKGDAANRALSHNGIAFEPHIAEEEFLAMLAGEKNLSGALGFELASVTKSGTTITSLTGDGGLTVTGKVFVDASYTADLMADSGVSYAVGRESTQEYGEPTAGVGPLIQLGNKPVSAYVVKGDPASGLVAHVSRDVVGEIGSGDDTVMAYNYRLCVSSDASNQIPFAPPAGYDPAEYELAARLQEASNPKYGFKDFVNIVKLPNHKFDVNTALPFSTDEVGVSNRYPEGSAAVRAEIEAEQKRYMEGFFYFLATDSRIPETFRADVKALGLCKDEFTENGGWPEQIYVREARRMLGDFVLTEVSLQEQTIPDSIAVGAYDADDHLHHVVAQKGFVLRERTRGYKPKAYPMPYRVLTPKAAEATNLLVPVAVSASHWAYDTLRIELTYMELGQAAGAAAALAVEKSVPVQGVDVGALRGLLLRDGAVISPDQR